MRLKKKKQCVVNRHVCIIVVKVSREKSKEKAAFDFNTSLLVKIREINNKKANNFARVGLPCRQNKYWYLIMIIDNSRLSMLLNGTRGIDLSRPNVVGNTFLEQ